MPAPIPPTGIVSIHNDYSYAAGWTARMVYCLPASEVAAFIEANYLAEYTASVKMAVVRITDEPWMEGDVVLSAGTSQTRKVTLHFAVVYLDVPWPDNVTRPDYATGTTLKLHVRYASEYMPLKGRSLKPSTGPAPGMDVQESILICQNEYNVEWDRVEDTGDLDFSDLVGCVNADDFMGCAAGTLLCAGASQDPSFVLDPANPLSWKTKVTLRQRSITVSGSDNDNDGQYGWNDWFNPATQKWEPIALANGAPKYAEVDFLRDVLIKRRGEKGKWGKGKWKKTEMRST